MDNEINDEIKAEIKEENKEEIKEVKEEVIKVFKTVDGKYTKEKMNEYMKNYIKDNNEDTKCDLCKGHYKKVTGKFTHMKTKKHIKASKAGKTTVTIELENENVKKEIESYIRFKALMKSLEIKN